MNSFFINKLVFGGGGYNYKSVQRWTSPKRLKAQGQTCGSVFDLDLFIVPVHLGNHWTLAVVYLQTQRIEYYDSLKGYNSQVVEGLLRWVSDESANKLGKAMDTSGWEKVSMTHLEG